MAVTAGTLQGRHRAAAPQRATVERRSGWRNEHCPPSPSSGDPTWARAPCSTASSVNRPPSSRTIPGSPATARCSRPNGWASRSSWSIPAAGCPTVPTSTRRSAVRSRPPCGAPIWCCSSSTRRPGSPTTMQPSRCGCAETGRQVLLVANKADNDRRENERWEFLSLGIGDPYPGQRVARPPGRGPARRGHRPHPERHGRRARRGAPGSRGRSAEEGRGRPQAASCRHRRSPQRRQEHPVQPAGGRGPFGRPRHARHDP